jgi:hypothetical protein
MRDFVNRNLAAVLMGLGAVFVVSLIVNIVLVARVASIESRLEQNADDLARVEIGAGLFASQVSGLQEQLAQLGPRVTGGLDEAVAGLRSFRTSTIQFDVPIDESIAIETEILLDRTLNVPIQTTFPVDQVVDTTITIAGPFETEIPLDVTVPVQLDIPVELDVPIAVSEVIPISTEVPVRLNIPIAVDVAGTELATLADALEAGLEAFADLMADFE